MHSDDLFPLHYEALGVPEDATTDVIRTAWREIARSSHPDHVGADAVAGQRFKSASDAWSVLRDAEARAAYDAELAQLRMPRCIQCGQPSASRLCTLCAISSMRPPRPAPAPKPAPRPAPKPAPRPAPFVPPPIPPIPPIPEEPVASRLRREAAEQDAVNRTHAYDDIDQLHAPSGDNLLEALLADAAVRAAGSAPKKKKKRKGSKLEVKVAPGFTVSLEGETYETLAGVNKNLRLANRLLGSISRFFRG